MRIWVASLIGIACASVAQADPSLATAKGLDGFLSADRFTKPENEILALGYDTYADTCQNCHGGNKATGAPKVTSINAWQKRIPKGMDVLIDHALNGFVGPTYTQMPARGANPDLTDDEVAAAVAYMIWLSGGSATAEDYLNSSK